MCSIKKNGIRYEFRTNAEKSGVKDIGNGQVMHTLDLVFEETPTKIIYEEAVIGPPIRPLENNPKKVAIYQKEGVYIERKIKGTHKSDRKEKVSAKKIKEDKPIKIFPPLTFKKKRRPK